MKRAEIIRLCESLLQDMQQETPVSIEMVVHRASHIANLVGHDSMRSFLHYERTGYPESYEPDNYTIQTNRWDVSAGKRMRDPAALIHQNLLQNEAISTEYRSRLKYNKLGVDFERMEVEAKLAHLAREIHRDFNIIFSIRGLISHFVMDLISELKFSKQSAQIFERYQKRVDGKIAHTAKDALDKLPSVFERLSAGALDTEAISHALTSCRRMIEAFADAVFPPQREPVSMGNHTIDCSSGKVKNQIQAYIWQSTGSESRRVRLNCNVRLLYDRVSAGVHADVTSTEAQALVLNTYLLLGELVELGEPKTMS